MVEGWAVQNNSLFFKNFIDKMIAQGFDDFIIDLLECRGMDSTFMGTLLCIINQVHTKAPVTLINVNDNNQKLLDTLGLNNILNISKKSIEIPKSSMFQIPEESDFLFENKFLRLSCKKLEHLLFDYEKHWFDYM